MNYYENDWWQYWPAGSPILPRGTSDFIWNVKITQKGRALGGKRRWIKLVLLSVNVEDTMVFGALCWPSAGYTLQVIVCSGGNGILQLLGRLTGKVLPQSVNFTFSITFSGTLSVIGVDMKPGSTQLHRIPNLKGGRKGNELQMCFYRVHLLTCWAPLQLSWLKPPLQL